MMQDILQKALETTSFLRERIRTAPNIGIILGSGLGTLADEVKEDRVEIPYAEIPNFPVSKVEGHENKLIIGKLYGKNVIVMQGRFHYYEGFDMDEITFPVRVMGLLGIDKLIVTNSVGAINTNYKPCDLMIIKDYINMPGISPLRGDNEDVFGIRFPNMTHAFSKRLIELTKNVASLKAFDSEFDKKAMKQAKDMIIDVKEGVYAYNLGPQYETPAEIRMLRLAGADAVAMSLVPETIVANHMGIEVLGMSCVTNVADGENIPSHEEVIENAQKAEEKFKNLVLRVIMKI